MSFQKEVIKRPIVSEKGTHLSEIDRVYFFEVSSRANKQEIKEAVESLFDVDVIGVRTMMVHGKHKRAGRFLKKRSNWKKALVQVKEGQKIEIFQGV